MLKKFFLSILLGIFALSGCNNDDADNKEVTVEPIPMNLTQEQKEEYYQKYVAIIEEINAEHNTDLELEPIATFSDDHWIEVADFEKLAKERADTSIVVLENNKPYSPMSAPKTVELQIGSKETNIMFDGSFDTKYNPNVSGGGQLFSAFNGISSEAENSDGSWTQIGYNDSLMDNEATYVIDVSGKYSQRGIISKHTMSLKFNCDKNGGIS